MVSFSCEQCNDTVKKPKLDQHAGRCRGAYFTCIDCNTTFEGTSYRAHTSCVSEEQRYHKSIYKAPKGKGKKAQQGQNGAPAPASAAAPEPAPAPAPAPALAPASAPPVEAKKVEAQSKEADKKRAREDEVPAAAAVADAPAPAAAAAAVDGGAGEPAQKKKKKSKKAKGEAGAAAGASEAGGAAQEAGSSAAAVAPSSVKTFLSEAVTPLLAGDNVSLADVREKVVEQAKAKGFKVVEVEKALWAGLKVGGKKQKVRAEFA